MTEERDAIARAAAAFDDPGVGREVTKNVLLRVPAPEKTEIKIIYQTPQGRMEMTIPHPPVERHDSDFHAAMAAALVGLALLCGIKPRNLDKPEGDAR